MLTSLLLSLIQSTFVSVTFLLRITRDFALCKVLFTQVPPGLQSCPCICMANMIYQTTKYDRNPPSLYFTHFMLSDKVFLVKSSGLGKNDKKMLLSLQVSSVFLSSHHLFSCRSVQLLQLSYCQSLLYLLSNASALCWIYCFVIPPHEMSPWLFSSGVLDIMEAGFSL